jgi:hypothetical protein
MKKHWFYNWQIWFGAALVALSVSIYTLEYLIFHNRQTIAVWILNDLAFIPISVLLVTMVLDQLMLSRDRQARMEKNNMVIGAFFSEVGSNLLGWLAQYDPKSSEIGKQLLQKHAFDPINVKQLKDGCCNYGFEVKMSVQAFNDLKALLAGKREFMVRLLENQSLMEHEAFTDLLWATFHLADELSLRNNYDSLPDPASRSRCKKVVPGALFSMA